MSGRLSVGTLSATYLVPASHPDETGVRLRLDGVARRLGGPLEAPLAQLAAERGEEVWLFRRLDAEVELDLAADDDALARAWADGVAAAVAARLGPRRSASARGSRAGPVEAAEDVVCFADRAAQLAAFVADVAAGVAWDRWWHEEFDGLRALPAGAAIEAALATDAPRGRAALAALVRAGRLPAVAASLGARGSARVVDALFASGVPSSAEALPAARRALALGLEGETAALFVCAAAFERAGVAPSPAAARRAVAAATLEETAPRARAASALQEGTAPRPQAALEALSEATSTRLGGAFLLLRGLVRLFADLDGPTRLLVLRSALGAERALESGADPVLAAVAGDDPDGEPLALLLPRALVEGGRAEGIDVVRVPTEHGVLAVDAGSGAWLGIDAPAETPDPPNVAYDDELAYFLLPDEEPVVAVAGRAVLRELAVRIGGFERSTPQHVWRNVLDRPARVEPHAGGLRVLLGPAPLDVMLRLAGIDRDRFDVPWLGEVSLSLSP
jgi:hypothetical protein